MHIKVKNLLAAVEITTENKQQFNCKLGPVLQDQKVLFKYPFNIPAVDILYSTALLQQGQ